jgi:hypothetical protein
VLVPYDERALSGSEAPTAPFPLSQYPRGAQSSVSLTEWFIVQVRILFSLTLFSSISFSLTVFVPHIVGFIIIAYLSYATPSSLVNIQLHPSYFPLVSCSLVHYPLRLQDLQRLMHVVPTLIAGWVKNKFSRSQVVHESLEVIIIAHYMRSPVSQPRL